MWLHTLKITSLQGFRTLFSHDAFRGLENLKVLEVSDCLMLKEIVELEQNEEEIVELEQNEERRGSAMIDKTIIPRLQTLKLSGLPRIRYFCTFSNGLELPSLEVLNIKNCPMMETFAFESFDNSMPNPIPSVFFRKEVICPNLRELVVDGCNFITPMFSHEIPAASLNALRRLKVENCHSLKNLFSPEIFRELANLEELRIEYCQMLEEVIAEEKETIHIGEVQETKVVWKLPKLKLLELQGLPKMVRFSYLQSDLELPSLQRITIYKCPKVKSALSLGLKCLPNGLRVKGISTPNLSSCFFFDKEPTKEEDGLNHDCFKFFQGDLSFTSNGWGGPELRVWSNEFFFDGWESAHGEIEIEKLTLGITYEIVFEIMLDKEEYSNMYSGLKLIINVALDQLVDQLEEDMTDKPTDEWVEILGGEFTPSSGQHGRLRFSVAKNVDYVDGVLLKGVYIRPKGITA